MTEESEDREVLFVPEFSPGRIYVCFDGSPHSKRALSIAISIASTYRSGIVVGHSVPLPLNGFGLGEPYYGWDEFEKSAKNRIEKMIQPYADGARKLGITLTLDFLGGTVSVVEALLADAEKEKAGLIIMGSRGLGGFRGLMIGSVSQAMAAHANVPVLILK